MTRGGNRLRRGSTRGPGAGLLAAVAVAAVVAGCSAPQQPRAHLRPPPNRLRQPRRSRARHHRRTPPQDMSFRCPAAPLKGPHSTLRPAPWPSHCVTRIGWGCWTSLPDRSASCPSWGRHGTWCSHNPGHCCCSRKAPTHSRGSRCPTARSRRPRKSGGSRTTRPRSTTLPSCPTNSAAASVWCVRAGWCTSWPDWCNQAASPPPTGGWPRSTCEAIPCTFYVAADPRYGDVFVIGQAAAQIEQIPAAAFGSP